MTSGSVVIVRMKAARGTPLDSLLLSEMLTTRVKRKEVLSLASDPSKLNGTVKPSVAEHGGNTLQPKPRKEHESWQKKNVVLFHRIEDGGDVFKYLKRLARMVSRMRW